MGRRKSHRPLNVLMNNRLVGQLSKEASGAIRFAYDQTWLDWEDAIPVSLSLPFQKRPFTGGPVAAVFENLLPDSDAIRRRVAERVGAESNDAYGLLAKIGRDCVGALQIVEDGEDVPETGPINGVRLDEGEIEDLLRNLARTPLGLEEDDDFRLSVAGAQEKTALLRHDGHWRKPLGTTPTTHILKPQIGQIDTPGGRIDLSHSVENEFYCLTLLRAFGLEVPDVEMAQFGSVRVLIVKRFDRSVAQIGRLIRLPQEDCCQALSIPPGQKYQKNGGPNAVLILKLLSGSETRRKDQTDFFKSLLLFWLIGATDGHGKNFSIFLLPGGRYRLTPIYDVLTAQPGIDAAQIRHNAFKLAMSVGASNHYRVADIQVRHFLETAKAAGLGLGIAQAVIAEVEEKSEKALAETQLALPKNFPAEIVESVTRAVKTRARLLASAASA